MATRRPMYWDDAAGHPKAVTAPDTIDPAVLPAAGSVPIVVANGVTYTVPANAHAFARTMKIQPSGELIIPADSELIFV